MSFYGPLIPLFWTFFWRNEAVKHVEVLTAEKFADAAEVNLRESTLRRVSANKIAHFGLKT